MVALKDYRPNNLSINPFQLGQEIAKPYDYDGALKEMMNWQQLTNQEVTTDFNQVKAEEAQKDFEMKNKRDEIMKAKLDAGEDLDLKEIAKSVGDYEGLLKIGEESKKQQLAEEDRRIKNIKDLSSIGKSNPEYSQQLAGEMGIGDFRAPIQKGDKPDKPKAPKLETWIIGDQMVDVDMNDLAAVREARNSGGRKRKDLSASALDQFEQLMEDKLRPPSAPEGEKQGFFSWLNGDKAPEISKGNRDTQAPTVVPPGMKLQRNKATGEVRMVPINGR